MNNVNVTLSAVTTSLASSSAPTVSDQEEVLLMPEWGYTLTAIILFFIGFFGFSFNLIVIVLMFKDVQVRQPPLAVSRTERSIVSNTPNANQLWTPINIILLNLVTSDFSVSVFGNPFTFTAALSRRWIFGSHLCVFYGYFMSLLGRCPPGEISAADVSTCPVALPQASPR